MQVTTTRATSPVVDDVSAARSLLVDARTRPSEFDHTIAAEKRVACTTSATLDLGGPGLLADLKSRTTGDDPAAQGAVYRRSDAPQCRYQARRTTAAASVRRG